MVQWIEDPISDEETLRIAAPAAGLADSVRDLIDAVIRSEVSADELTSIRGEVDALTKRLRVQQLPGSFGETHGMAGALRAWGNAVIGLRNAIAPPLVNTWHADGTIVGEATLTSAYEGPPGRAHGGVAALLLDQVMGEAAHAAERPGFTARLSLNYRNPTPLGRIRAVAKAEPPAPGEEHKTVVLGTLYSIAADGTATVCVEADGLFILPRAARAKLQSSVEREGM